MGHVAMRGGVILFTSHNIRHFEAVNYCAERCGEYALVGDPMNVAPNPDRLEVLPDVLVMFTNKTTEMSRLPHLSQLKMNNLN